MSSLEKKRDDFQKYLESGGAIDNLTKALIKLYEQQNKSEIDPVKFIRKNMCETCPDDEQFEVMAANLEKANKKICQLERELIRLKGSIKRTASEIDLALSKGFDELNSDNEKKSLLKMLLTKDIMEQLKAKKTNFKGTLLDCVQSGLEIQDTPIGIYACDADAYTVFAPLFEPLIENIHDFKKDSKHPALDWGDVCKIPQFDESVISIQIQCIRSIDCFPFTANMNMDHYEEIMKKVQSVTKCMSGDFKGKFYPLEGMDKDFKKTLIDDGIVFPENSQLLRAANATRFWPTGRGIFVNEARTFVIWCNEEDHLRFVSMEKSGNLKNVYDRLMTGVTQISRDIAMTYHEKFGFLTFSPENLGNTICVSVQMKLQKLSQAKEKIDEFADKFSLTVMNPTDNESNIYEIRSKKRLGVTEYQTIIDFAEGVNSLAEIENSL